MPFIELTMVTAQVVSSLLDLHVNGVVNCSDRCTNTNCFTDGENIDCKRAFILFFLSRTGEVNSHLFKLLVRIPLGKVASK